MKKADPEVAVTRFVDQLHTARSDWEAIDVALQEARLPLAVRRRATAASFLAIAVAWEGFLTEWWVAAANRDPEKLIGQKEKTLRSAAVAGGFPEEVLVAPMLLTSHLNVEQTRRLLGADRNLSFPTYDDLQKSAKIQLGQSYVDAVGKITRREWQHAEMTRLARNALAHQSKGAWKALNDQASKATIIPPLRHVISESSIRRRKSRALDSQSLPLYLHKTPSGSTKVRLLILSEGLETIATRLN